MPTALTSLANLRIIFGLGPTDTTMDSLLNLYLADSAQLICDWCGLTDFGLSNYLELLSGDNTPALTVRQLPLVSLAYTGDLTSGSVTVVNVSSTANLFVNQSVLGAGLAAGATVAAIGSSTIMLSKPA